MTVANFLEMHQQDMNLKSALRGIHHQTIGIFFHPTSNKFATTNLN